MDNAEAEALVFDARFSDRVAAIRDQLPRVKLFVAIDDGSGGSLDGAPDFEALIASQAPLPRRAQNEDDIYMLYTGGTTGMPKGVMLRQGAFSQGVTAALAANLRGLTPPADLDQLVELVRQLHAADEAPVSLPACPLMHGTGVWGGAFGPHALGGSVVTMRGEHFDPDALWQVVADERVSDLVIVGDAFAKPMLATLRAAGETGRMPDLSQLKRIISSGVMFSREVKEGLLELVDVTIFDVMGSTEGGMGSSVVSRANPPGDTARFMPSPGVKIFNALDKEVQPGSDEVGMVASLAAAQLGYFKDEAKTAATFRVIDGVRYSFPGDFAQLAADGSLILLGRGSVCINTGGEKVYPEEVEEALKAHPDVFDCLVVGVPDPRFGERVTAVLSLSGGRTLDEFSRPQLTFARSRVAGCKSRGGCWWSTMCNARPTARRITSGPSPRRSPRTTRPRPDSCRAAGLGLPTNVRFPAGRQCPLTTQSGHSTLSLMLRSRPAPGKMRGPQNGGDTCQNRSSSREPRRRR